MSKQQVKYKQIGIRFTQEEIKILKRVQTALKRRTVTDTLRYLVLHEGEKNFSNK